LSLLRVRKSQKNNDRARIVSIIIPHYGSYAVLKSCLNSILDHTKDAEVIVVDNDMLPSEFEEAYPSVRLTRVGSNQGFGLACNLGAEIAKGDLLVFMNNDMEVAQGWLNPLLRAVADDRVGAACPVVLYRERPNIVNSAGGSCDRVALGWNRGIGKPRNSEMERGFFYLPGSCIVLRKAVFEKTGGFDPQLFLFLEDVDLSWRLRLAGYGLALVTKSTILHEWMKSTGRLSPSDIQYLHNRNRLRLILKNYSMMSLLLVLPIWAVLQLALLGWIIFRRQSLELRTVLAGWLWNTRNLSGTMRARASVQSLRTRKDSEVVKFMYPGMAGVHLLLGTMRHPAFEAYFKRGKNERSRSASSS
jgi:GT2 family glycosyltransferase